VEAATIQLIMTLQIIPYNNALAESLFKNRISMQTGKQSGLSTRRMHQSHEKKGPAIRGRRWLFEINYHRLGFPWACASLAGLLMSAR